MSIVLLFSLSIVFDCESNLHVLHMRSSVCVACWAAVYIVFQICHLWVFLYGSHAV